MRSPMVLSKIQTDLTVCVFQAIEKKQVATIPKSTLKTTIASFVAHACFHTVIKSDAINNKILNQLKA